jgi:hypothetical protein
LTQCSLKDKSVALRNINTTLKPLPWVRLSVNKNGGSIVSFELCLTHPPKFDLSMAPPAWPRASLCPASPLRPCWGKAFAGRSLGRSLLDSVGACPARQAGGWVGGSRQPTRPNQVLKKSGCPLSALRHLKALKRRYAEPLTRWR